MSDGGGCTCAQEDRSQVLWRALERAIPDVRERAELVLVGTPLTHERFLNRHRGTYGAAISAASGSFPGPQTPIPGLYRHAPPNHLLWKPMYTNCCSSR